jgi:hypothetical protein
MGKRALPMPQPGVTPISNRNDASMAGLKVFFTGVPCSKGHLDWRYVCNDGCRSCMKPPKPVTPWHGLGDYAAVLQLKLRVRAMPPLEHVRYLELEAERAIDKWLVLMGYAPKRVEVDDGQ